MECKVENRRRQEGKRGATLIEYAVLAALIVIVALTAIQVVGSKVSQQFSNIANQLSS